MVKATDDQAGFSFILGVGSYMPVDYYQKPRRTKKKNPIGFAAPTAKRPSNKKKKV